MTEELPQDPEQEPGASAVVLPDPIVSNAKHNADGGIDCTVDHPLHGLIPYHARPDDPNDFGARVWAVVSDPGFSVAPADPVVADVPQVVTRLQLARGMDDLGLWATFEAALEDPATPANVKRDWSLANEIERGDPLVVAFAASLSLTETDLDNLFIQAATHSGV